MGVILDSAPVITAERNGETAEDFLKRVLQGIGDQEIALSAISYTELLHGVYRVMPTSRRALSRSFLAALTYRIPVYPFTMEAAELAGRIDAEQRAAGLSIPFADLLIGATALSLNYSVLSMNERHFRLIPGLEVLSF